jgi:hypothetical protein
MQRAIEPELLDELPPEDPRAVRSRKDLRLLNALMGNVSHIAAPLARRPAPRQVMDIGAGDGLFSLALLNKLQWRNTEFILVDRIPTVSEKTLAAFQCRDCKATLRTTEVMAGLGNSVDVMFANLFLHHFEDDRIRDLLKAVAERCSIFVSCEPRRSAWSLLASRCVGLLGCNAVTRHDAVASVRAGFAGDELSRLWPLSKEWSLREGAVGSFGHRFVATRL